MANKIRYGLKGVKYAIATIDASNNTATYGSPVAIPGAVSLSMDAQGENTPFYADNIVYYLSVANSGYEGDLEIAEIPRSFEEDVLGNVEDAKQVLFEDADANPVHFALMFQFEGDEKATKHVLYNCVASRPAINGSTKEESITPETTTLSLTATSIHNTVLNKDVVKAKADVSTDSTVYSGFFSEVYMGTAPAAQNNNL